MVLKCITLNIQGGGFIQKVISFIKEENPHIVLLQEVISSENHKSNVYNSLQLLTKELGEWKLAFAPTYSTTRGYQYRVW